MTLDDLYKEFEKSRDHFVELNVTEFSKHHVYRSDYSKLRPELEKYRRWLIMQLYIEECIHGFHLPFGYSDSAVAAYQTMVDLSRRYIIARDFNEFDPQRADMLWKLQNQ